MRPPAPTGTFAQPTHRWLRPLALSQGEYQANLAGLNTVFGAVLGFVLAGTETLSPERFAGVLLVSATAVTSLLYISHSRHRLRYAVITAILIAVLPDITERIAAAHIPKLRPTLAVWLAITLIVEFAPRTAE